MNDEIKELFLNNKTDTVDYLIINEYLTNLDKNNIELKWFAGSDKLIKNKDVWFFDDYGEAYFYGNVEEVSIFAKLFDYLNKIKKIKIINVETKDQKIIDNIIYMSYSIEFYQIYKIV